MTLTRVMLLTGLLGALTACTKDDDTADSGDSSVALTCAEQSAEDCDPSACDAISARPMTDVDGEWCVDFDDATEPKGCMDQDQGCGDAETLAASGDDPSTCWWFPSTCIPEGWTLCEQTAADECASE